MDAVKTTLSEEMLKPIVWEYVLNPIGEELHKKNKKNKNLVINKFSELLKSAKKKNNYKNVSAIFLGWNKQTTFLHLLLLNDNYRSVPHLNQGELVVPKTIDKEQIISNVLNSISETYNPYNPLEAPSRLMGKCIDNKPNLGENAYAGDDFNDDGLSMLAFNLKRPVYSPCAFADKRSWNPGLFDLQLGLQEALYLPIFDDSNNPFGILFISIDIELSQIEKHPPEINADGLIPSDKRSDSFKNLCCKSYAEIEKIELELKDIWEKVTQVVQERFQLLNFLFRSHLEMYMNYVSYFDNFIVDENIKENIKYSDFLNRNLKLGTKLDLEKLKNFNITAGDFLAEFFEKENKDRFPTINYLTTLKELEPLLLSMGKKEHYVHMFKVFLLGNRLIDLWITDTHKKEVFYEIWSLIAFSHDIGYPIEMVEKEITEFFEKYFHRRKVPQILITKDLLSNYGKFQYYRYLLMDGAADKLFDEKEYAGIFFDMTDYYFKKLNDHAVISALFTMMCIDVRWENGYNLKDKYKNILDYLGNLINNENNITVDEGNLKEAFLQLIGLPILVHNLHQWKYYYYNELKEIDPGDNRGKNFQKQFDDNQDQIIPSSDCTDIFSFLWDRNFAQKNKEEIKRYLQHDYIDKCHELSISDISRDPSTHKDVLKFFCFLLSLSDFIQEVGRDKLDDELIVPRGLYITKLEDEVIHLRTPFIYTFKLGELSTIEAENFSTNIYRDKDDFNYSNWKMNPDYSIEFKRDSNNNETPEKKYKTEQKKNEKDAKNNYRDLIESGKGIGNDPHPYVKVLQVDAAFKAFEIDNKYSKLYYVKDELKITFENIIDKKPFKYLSFSLKKR